MACIPTGTVTTDREDWERNVAAARTRLAAAEFEALWNEGCAMKLDEAVDYALKREE